MMAKSTSYTEMHRKIRIEKRRRRISFVLQLLFVILLSALTAAAFLVGKAPGLYDLQDIVR